MEKLLDLLKFHARLSNEQLAVMLGTTEAAVANEMQNLKRRGYKGLWCYHRRRKA